MPDPTPDQRIDRDRREKWVAFRRKRGMADDAPFVGKDPWEKCYEEALDALNYLGQVPPHFKGTDELTRAMWWARLLARICLKHMKGGTE